MYSVEIQIQKQQVSNTNIKTQTDNLARSIKNISLVFAILYVCVWYLEVAMLLGTENNDNGGDSFFVDWPHLHQYVKGKNYSTIQEVWQY